MEQLSAFDNILIHYGNEITPTHVGCMAIYDASTAEEQPVRFKHILANFQTRLHQAAVLRKRLVRVPGAVDYPYWITDPAFDIEFHMKHIALPEPGDWRQLCIQVARIYARHLDMTRPPWEIYIIEGLNNFSDFSKPGHFAMLIKVHASLLKDNVVNILLSVMHDLTPHFEVSNMKEPLIADRFPTVIELLARASINSMESFWQRGRIMTKYGFSFLKFAVNTLLARKIKTPFNIPKTRFNQRIHTSHRIFESVQLTVSELQKVVNTLQGLTITDVVITIIAGGLRHYLLKHNELPESSLCALIPLSQKNTHGIENELLIFSKLYTDIDDPLERLHVLHRAMIRAKRGQQYITQDLLSDCAQLVPTTLVSLVTWFLGYYDVGSKISQLIGNTVIDYAVGPAVPLYLAGSKLVRMHTMGSLSNGIGLFHSVYSYNNTLTINVLSHREMIADPASYALCLQSAANDLLSAVEKAIQ